MTRTELMEKLRENRTYDMLVIGGGATGCGIALDAASRGLSVALVERGDFAAGTSSRSTKLVHGGVRYLEAALLHFDQVQYNLVKDALHERGVMLRIAPHLVSRLTLVTPLYSWFQIPYILAGLKIYDLLAGDMGLGPSQLMGRESLLQRFPMIRAEGLKGGVTYYDGQFNDARMNLALAQTAMGEGAVMANYVEVTGLVKENGRMCGALVRERISGATWTIRARGVINATGPFADQVRHMDDGEATPLLKLSSGVHIVLDRRFVPPEGGITIPKTEDGRVLFIIPWQGHCLVGTTDEAAEASEHPAVTEKDIDYLLRHLHRYFNIRVERSDLKAAWAGLRPLVLDPTTRDTARLARDHVISASPSGLLTIAGGKWTTYRKMALDLVDYAIGSLGLTPKAPCHTERLVLHGGRGFDPNGDKTLMKEFGLDQATADHLNRSYGDRSEAVARLSVDELREPLVAGHPYLKGEVIYAMRHELAVKAMDILSHRLPLALLDNSGARGAAPWVIKAMGEELGWDAGRMAEELQELQERLVGVL